MTFLDDKLARGETIILDGGTGTELERRGAKMSDQTWCAAATLTDQPTTIVSGKCQLSKY